MAQQQGDVLLFQTNDDGNILIENGIAEMSAGLETAAYLSLFGGNEDDDGRKDNPDNWWGNIDEGNPSSEYHSETQNLLQAIPATTGNLLRVQKAAERDLAWFTEDSIASSVTVEASLPALNTVKLVINIEANGEESSFQFTENWRASV
jgi:phage gp46-like protein